MTAAHVSRSHLLKHERSKSWPTGPHRALVGQLAHATDGGQRVQVRQAVNADADLLAQFTCSDRGQSHTHDVEKLIRTDVASDVRANSDELRVVVALDADDIVGVVAHSLTDIDGIGRVQYIHALGVHPAYRRRRLIGTLLKQNVLNYSHLTGIQTVASSVHRRSHPMLGLNLALHAVTKPDPDDGDYMLTITASQPVDDDHDTIAPDPLMAVAARDRCRRGFDGVDEVTVDLSAVTLIDSAGARMITTLASVVGEAGGRFIVRGPSPIVQYVFDIIGVSLPYSSEERSPRSSKVGVPDTASGLYRDRVASSG